MCQNTFLWVGIQEPKEFQLNKSTIMVELTYLSLKKTIFCSYFRHISLCFYSNFDRESSLDAEFDSASNKYPHCTLLMEPATPKTRNTWKNVMMTTTSTYTAYFWQNPLPQKQEIPEKTWWWVFQVFLVFGVAGSIKSMQCGYSLDAESNSASNELSRSKFE